jgi:hypothetical protein
VRPRRSLRHLREQEAADGVELLQVPRDQAPALWIPAPKGYQERRRPRLDGSGPELSRQQREQVRVATASRGIDDALRRFGL